MANAFDAYTRAKSAALQEGQQMYAMEQAVKKIQREKGLRDILSQSYSPEGGMNMENAIGAMYQGGYGPEAMELEASQAKLGGATPSSVNEYNFMKSLPPEEQERFLGVKRAQQYLKTGPGYVAPSQVSPTAVPTMVAPTGLKPTEEPTYIAEKTKTAKEAAMKAEAQTKAQIGLQKGELQYEKNMSLVENVLKHPGLDESFGKLGVIPAIPGSDKANFRAQLEQLQNTVFITNREALKGGGAITDFEGNKAEQAEIRAAKAQSAEEFRKAMKDYKKWVDKGFANMKKAAKGDFSIKDVSRGTNQDQEALKWANANPNDPRAIQILKLQGSR